MLYADAGVNSSGYWRIRSRTRDRPIVTGTRYALDSWIPNCSLCETEGELGTVGLLRKARSVILSAAKNLRDVDSTRLRRPFTLFRVT